MADSRDMSYPPGYRGFLDEESGFIGMTCMQCSKLMRYGEPYYDRVAGVHRGEIVLELVCADCFPDPVVIQEIQDFLDARDRGEIN